MASTAMIGAGSAVDLALLGLVAERPRPIDELISAVKAVGGDRFAPTAAFVEGRAAQLIEDGCLERQHGDDRLCDTVSGTAHLMRLLCLDVDPAAPTLWPFCTTLKLSLLHLAGAECRREAVATLLRVGRHRVSRLEMVRWADCSDPMMERCLALEEERAALELRWIQNVMMSQGIEEVLGEAAA